MLTVTKFVLLVSIVILAVALMHTPQRLPEATRDLAFSIANIALVIPRFAANELKIASFQAMGAHRAARCFCYGDSSTPPWPVAALFDAMQRPLEWFMTASFTMSSAINRLALYPTDALIAAVFDHYDSVRGLGHVYGVVQELRSTAYTVPHPHWPAAPGQFITESHCVSTCGDLYDSTLQHADYDFCLDACPPPAFSEPPPTTFMCSVTRVAANLDYLNNVFLPRVGEGQFFAVHIGDSKLWHEEERTLLIGEPPYYYPPCEAGGSRPPIGLCDSTYICARGVSYLHALGEWSAAGARVPVLVEDGLCHVKGGYPSYEAVLTWDLLVQATEHAIADHEHITRMLDVEADVLKPPVLTGGLTENVAICKRVSTAEAPALGAGKGRLPSPAEWVTTVLAVHRFYEDRGRSE